MYIYIYIYIYVYVYMCTYVCMCLYTHTYMSILTHYGLTKGTLRTRKLYMFRRLIC